MHGFGPVATEDVSDAPWGLRVHGLMVALAAGGHVRASFRHAIERMPPAEYLESSYYEHWLHALETLLHDRLDDPGPSRAAGPDQARALLAPFAVARAAEPAPRLAVGDRVTVRRWSTPGHTRCPRYVRGATGTVDRVHWPARLPDDPRRVEPFYSVAFTAADLWGAGDHTVSVDLWESYLR